MITSFRVGSVFEIKDEATAVIQRLAVAMRELATLTGTVREELQSMSSIRIGSVTTRVNALTGAMDKTTTAATNMANATSSGIAEMDTGLNRAIEHARILQTELGAAGRAGAGIGRGVGRGGGGPPVPGAGGGAGRGGGRHGPHQGWHLGRFGAGIPVAGGHVHASTPSTATGVAVGAGVFGIYELMEQSKEPLHQRALLKAQGIDEATIDKIETESRTIARLVPGSGFSKNMKTMGELYSIVGPTEMFEMAPAMAELDRVQSIITGKDKDSGYTTTKAVDLMGKLTDPVTHQLDEKAFHSILNNMGRINIATHGKVTPEEWLGFAKQAGPAAGSLTEEGIYTAAAVLQTMSGQRAGTAFTAVQRQFAGGVMTKTKADELKDIGIFKEGDYTVERGGHVQFKRHAAQEFVSELQRDPLDAVVRTLIPALESHGFQSNEDIQQHLYKILGTAPEQREIFDLIRNRNQIAQERERAKQALAPGSAVAMLSKEDPEAVASAFSTAFKDFLGAAGGPLMQAAVPGLNALTNALNAMSQAATAHPSTTGVLTTIGAGAAAGAGAGFISGWLGGPIGAGGGAIIGGIGGGIYALSNLPTKTLPNRNKDVWGNLPSLTTPASAAPAQHTTVNLGGITINTPNENPTSLAERVLAEVNRLLTQGITHNQGGADSASSSPFVSGVGMP